MWFLSMIYLSQAFVLTGLHQSSHTDLDLVISNEYLLIALLPCLLLLSGSRTFSAPANRWVGNETEFIMTRAIDRNIFYRSKATLLSLIVLIVPVALLLFSFKAPDLQASLHTEISPARCLSHISGSKLVASLPGEAQPLIFIPSGNLLIATWHLWAAMMITIAVQLVVLSPLPYFDFVRSRLSRLHILWKMMMIIIWASLVLRFSDALWDAAHLANNDLFFSFAAHQTDFWIVTVPMLIVGQLWCERRFSRLEQ